MSQLRLGYLYGIGAYALWGFMPLYIKLLPPAGPVEVLAHRVVWSVVFIAVVLGVGMLHERLRAAQWTAVGIGGTAVAVLTADYGRVPYLALTLALSFGAYGLLKKRLGLPAAQGLFVEAAVLALPALGYLGWLGWRTESTFAAVSPGHTALLVAAGAVTAIPLLFFAGAANRIPLAGLGMLQYIAPILQLGCGVLVFREPMPPVRLAGFALVWVALTLFTIDGIRHARAQGRTGPLPVTLDRARRAQAEPVTAAARS